MVANQSLILKSFDMAHSFSKVLQKIGKGIYSHLHLPSIHLNQRKDGDAGILALTYKENQTKITTKKTPAK